MPERTGERDGAAIGASDACVGPVFVSEFSSFADASDQNRDPDSPRETTSLPPSGPPTPPPAVAAPAVAAAEGVGRGFTHRSVPQTPLSADDRRSSASPIAARIEAFIPPRIAAASAIVSDCRADCVPCRFRAKRSNASVGRLGRTLDRRRCSPSPPDSSAAPAAAAESKVSVADGTVPPCTPRSTSCRELASLVIRERASSDRVPESAVEPRASSSLWVEGDSSDEERDDSLSLRRERLRARPWVDARRGTLEPPADSDSPRAPSVGVALPPSRSVLLPPRFGPESPAATGVDEEDSANPAVAARSRSAGTSSSDSVPGKSSGPKDRRSLAAGSFIVRRRTGPPAVAPWKRAAARTRG